jgi:integrase
MGRTNKSGGVIASGNNTRIRFDFSYQGVRYRPTLPIVPTEKALQLARKRLEAIEGRIRNGTFSFADEFPEYRFLERVAPTAEVPLFRVVAAQYLNSVKSSLEYATYESYRKIIDSFWNPKIGDKLIPDIKYSDLTTELGNYPFGSRKTRNNVVSVVKQVFAFAIADKIISTSPAESLKSLKVQKTPPDPYTIAEAEQVIEGLRDDWGDWDANYFEYAFFSGLRPSEIIALQWADIDRQKGVTSVNKARVMGRNKDRTKTAVARLVENNPRAMEVLRRQWELTGLKGEHVFCKEDGRPYHDLQVQWKRWQFTHRRLGIRYREPYQTRHSSVSWNLMAGKNFMWVAKQHGHSYAVMLGTYATWLDGTTDAEISAIQRAMEFGPSMALVKLRATQIA